VNKSSLEPMTNTRRVFIACLLSFSILVTPMAAMASRSQSSEVRGQRSRQESGVRSQASGAKAAAREVFANPAPAMPAASPIIAASMVDSLENDDLDGKIDPTDGTGSTERIIYSTTITNSGTVDATGLQFTDTIDSHTTLVGGSLNVSPLAGDDSYDTIGNTLLEVGPVGSPSAQPKVTVGTGGSPKSVFDNDAEFLGDTFNLSKLQATTYPGSGTVTATSTHGSVTMDGSGHFSYLPTAGYTGDDTFTYTIKDSGNLESVGTVTIHVNTQRVWYVQNNSAGANQGTSENPFTTLASAQTNANAAGDIIYVFNGNNTTTNQNAGFTIQANNQRLIGEGVQLDAPVSVNGGPNPTVLRAAGTAAKIGNGAGDAVTVSNKSGVIIRGFVISDSANGIAVTYSAPGGGVTISNNSIAGGTGNAIDVTTTTTTTGGGSATISNNAITAAGAEGIDIHPDGTGTLNLTVDTNTLNATGPAFKLAETAGACNVAFNNNTGITSGNSNALSGAVDIKRTGGTLTVTSFANNQVAGASAGNAVRIDTATFDSDPSTGGNQALTPGALTIGASGGGNGAGLSGLVLQNTSGTLPFTALTIFTDNGRGIDANGSGSGTAGLTVTSGNLNVTSTGGASVKVDNLNIDLQNAVLSSTNSADNGVAIGLGGGVTGTFSATNASSITNATGDDFAVGAGTANITWNAALNNSSGGNAVDVTGHTGGTVSFTGAITDTVQGINLNSNTGATITFTGGLDINTGANAAFTATGGGTVTATQNNTSIINKLQTTTGTALNVANTTIGASGLTFRSINVTGNNTIPTSGIVLNSTGTSGGLTVTGNGGVCTQATQTCTGGTIQGTGSHGISLTTVKNIEFNLVSIKNTADHGLFGNGVDGFTLRDSIVFNFGNASANGPAGPSEDGLHFESTNNANTAAGHGLTGTVIIQRDAIGPDGHFSLTPNPPTPENKGIVIRNHNDTNLAMTVTGTTFFQISNDGIDAEVTDGTGTINVDGSTADGANVFNQINGRSVTFQDPVDDATARILDLTIKNNTFTNVGIGGRWLASGRCTMNARYLNNTMTSTSNDAIRSIADASDATLTPHATTNATITGNNFGGGSAFIAHHRQAVGNIAFNNNTNIGPVGGIFVSGEVRSTVGIDILNNSATVSGNAGQNALYLQTANNGTPVTDNSTICANISGNTLSENPNNTGFQATVVFDTVSNQGVINLEGWNGSSPTYDVFISNQNTLSGGSPNVIADNAANIHAGGNCVTSTPLLAAPGGILAAPGGIDAAQDFNSAATGFDLGQLSFPSITTSAFRRSNFGSPFITAPAVVVSESLSQQQLDAVVSGAIERWSATGLTPQQIAILRDIKFDVADLGNSYLGEADRHDHILIDRGAAGRGWFIDSSTLSDSYFAQAISATRLYSDPYSAPAGHVDLLTAIEHEMGHKLGLDDSYAAKDRDSVMYGYLMVDERRLPAKGQAIGARPGAVEVTHFLSLGKDERVTRVWNAKAGIAGEKSEVKDQKSEIRDQRSEVRLNHARSSNSRLKTENSKLSNALSPMPSGETVTFDNGGSGITLPAGKSITIVFKVTLNNLPNLSLLNPPRVSNQGRVFGTNFTLVNGFTSASPNTNDPAPPVLAPGTHVATETLADLFNTTTSVITSGSPSQQGDPVTFTATVSFNPTGSPAGTPGTPTGSVTFKDGASPITCDEGAGARPLNGSGVAVCTTSALSAAVHTINADYGGDGNFDTSTGSVGQTVNPCNASPVVTKIADTNDGTCDGDCSLREAIATACTNATITFDTAGVFSTPQTITLSLGQLSLGRNVTIDGPDPANQHVTISGGNASRVFNLNSGKTATIRDLTITGGLGINGGGIYNDHGTLTLLNLTIGGNTANTASFGGGVYNDGSTSGSATLTITNSTISGNLANSGDGGGVYNAGAGGSATLTINNSTISGNNATGNGGGVFSDGTGGAAVVTTTNATITNNHSDSDDSSAGDGGGLNLSAGTYKLRNTIVAGNFKGTSSPVASDIFGSVDTTNNSSNNLIGTGGAGGLTNGTNFNQVGVASPGLGPLASNGGPTLTHALLFGSPAIEAGDNTFSDAVSLTTDQRGAGFIRKADSADSNTTQTVDIGAFECQATVAAIPDKSTGEDTPLSFSFDVGDGVAPQITSVTASSSNTTLVPNVNANINVTGSGSTRTLNITPASNQFGTSTITVTVNAGSESMQTTFTLTVSAVADTPSVTPATTNEDTQTTSGLVITKNAADGAEVTFFKITSITNGSLFQNDGITPIGNGDFITVAQGGAGLKFTPAPDFFGNGSFQVAGATDNSGGGLGSAATATITVNAVADTPSITSTTTNEDTQSTTGLVISRNAADGAEVTNFKITGITNGTLFQNDGTTQINNNDFITFAQGHAGLKFTPAANLFSPSTTFTFTIQASTSNGDGGLGGSTVNASITVNPVADTPTVTNSSTNEDTQTTTGLVIDRNAVDGTEVAFFKITSITNGSLFKHDGTTPITNNSFITYAEGNAGLKFTPALNFNGNASFQVQGSIDNTGTGLSSGFATATITVGSVGDPPGVTNATTNEDTQTSSGLVITKNAADGADITVFKITNITNGTLFKHDGTTPINNGSYITIAEGADVGGTGGLRFTPGANLYSSVSTFSFDVAAAKDNTGAGLGNSSTATITVNPVADSPSVSPNPQTTAISTQTGPMVINRNASDGSEVTHFKITNITNGTLFQNDGSTPINNNDFITFAQGNAGLKFSPTAGLSSPGNSFGFDVQASLNNTNGGLGPDPAVHENILVSCSDPQVVTSTLDDGSAGTLRYAIANSCPGTGAITFNLAAGPQTITLGSTLTMTKALSITGPTNQAITINGGGNRVFDVTGGSPTIANLTVTGAVVSGSNGGGLRNSGAGIVTLNAMTFTGNSADNGGAIATTAGTIIINNSTISGNTATTDGGGLYVNGGTLTLLNDTITNNTGTAGQGGGLRVVSGTANVRNTIIAGNNAVSSANVGGTINDQGNNILSGNPKLGPLANNGGPTMTHALLAGSPALDAGDNTAAAALTTDQRGNTFGRVRDAGSDADTTQTVDIGAFEADPSVEDITDKITSEDTALPSFSFNVGDSFSAFDSITATSSNQTLVPNANVVLSGSGSTRSLSITPAANQFGATTITVTVTKTVNSTVQTMSDTFVLTVTTVPDTPSITNSQTDEDVQSTFGLVVTKNAVDGAEVNNFKITSVTGGTLFKNDGATPLPNGSFITIAEGGAGLKFTPAANSDTAGTVTVQASTDNIGTVLSPNSATATITIVPIADTPSVTNATTNEDTPTSSGLVISRNPVDGPEVTHFKITNITNGTVFKNGGTVQVTNNGFITVAEGNAGLQFRPAANLNSPGSSFSFQVQAATNGAGVGLSAGSATATITVNAVNDAPSFTKGADQTVLENSGAQTVNNWATNLSAGPSDESGQTLTFQIAGNTNPGLFSAGPAISSTGTLTYTPANNVAGTAQITVNLKDTGGTANGGVDTSAPQTFNINVTAAGFISFSSSTYNVNENAGSAAIIVNRAGDTTVPMTVDYATTDGQAKSRSDYNSVFGTLRFDVGDTTKTIMVPITQDAFNEGPESFTITLSNPTGAGVNLVVPSTATVTINDSASPTPNAIDDTDIFVRQQYHDFLNREADPSGLAFWKNNIDQCNNPANRAPGQTLAQCIEVQRILTSAAFFLSIEFMTTGTFVRNFYVAALDRPATGNMPAFNEWLRDTQAVQRGVIVGQAGWPTVLSNNRTAFMNDFVMRAEFVGLYPTTDTPTQYVDKLYLHAGVTPSASERSAAIAEFGGAPTAADPGARGRALLDVTQNAAFQAREMNRAFVQIEYFGYLRRNPNDPPDGNFNGYNFWLNKLNLFNGNYIDAEMVKAFISSAEYRRRFGP
jgi:CSLREA domain-containing protein